jgi:probable rRNA maturation factor
LGKQTKTRAESPPVPKGQLEPKSHRRTSPDDYVLINKQRTHAINRKTLQRFLQALVPELGIRRRSFSIVFITDQMIRRYNNQYRGFDKPTDVLSFSGDQLYLGDILISSETAYNQALNSRTLSFERNLRRLILHGLLHLMGYDHETDDGQMRTIERRLRRRFQC